MFFNRRLQQKIGALPVQHMYLHTHLQKYVERGDATLTA